MARVIETRVFGETLVVSVAGAGELRFDMSSVAGEIANQAMVHGFTQKICDAAAIPRDERTGRSASAQEKFEAMRVVMERLQAGEWNARREGDGGDGLLARAIAEVRGREVEKVRAWLGERSASEKRALRAVPEVAAVIARLGGAGDAEVMLAGL